MKDCKYRLPCNWCDKYDRMCEAILLEIHIQEEKNKKREECEHEWRYGTQSAAGHHYICTKCGTVKLVPLSSLGNT